MSSTEKAKARRIGLSAVPVRAPVSDRLAKYIDNQPLRLVKADVVSIAITQYLDRCETDNTDAGLTD